ncbi:hypothetical protein Kpol_1010p54, partial [Vanderwaltozyma polyspora DSM 70294]
MILIWFILSNFVILNLFIALIANSLEVPEEKKRELQLGYYLKNVYPRRIKMYRTVSLIDRIKKKIFRRPSTQDSKNFKEFLITGSAIMKARETEKLSNEHTVMNDQDISTYFKSISRFFRENINSKFNFVKKNPFYYNPKVIITESDSPFESGITVTINNFHEEKSAYLRKHPRFNDSYFIFSPNNTIRRLCQLLVPSSYGERIDSEGLSLDDSQILDSGVFGEICKDLFFLLSLAVTIALLVVSCYVTPLYKLKYSNENLNWVVYFDIGVTSFFTLEFIIKTVADGFIYTPNAYLRNPWNVIDFIVMEYMWIDVYSSIRSDNSNAKIFRAFTAIRIFRLITISDKGKDTFHILIFNGLSKLPMTAFASFCIIFPFTVWGLHLFRGHLGVCNDNSFGYDGCTNEFSNTVFKWSIMSPRVYKEPYLYFDNFGVSLKSLYEIISLEGWVDLLMALVNSTGVGKIPIVNASPGNAFFIILFNFISMGFILNLFVSTIIASHSTNTGLAFQTKDEKVWIYTKKLLSQAYPERVPDTNNYKNFRLMIFNFVNGSNQYYNVSVNVILYFHISLLLSQFNNNAQEVWIVRRKLYMATTTALLSSALLSLYGNGFRIYFKNKWMYFKFYILWSAFLFTFISSSYADDNISSNLAAKVFRSSIFLFIIPQFDVLSQLSDIAIASGPYLLPLAYTWLIVFLVFAITLNQLFGLTKLGPNTTENLNFRTVPKALLVLFRCSFGERWNYILEDIALSYPECTPNSILGNCESSVFAYIIIILWNIISMYIFMNIFASIIITHFGNVYGESNSSDRIKKRHIRNFTKAWKKFDFYGVGYIQFGEITPFLNSFEGPLSFKKWSSEHSIHNIVKNYMLVDPEDPYNVDINFKGLDELFSKPQLIKIHERKETYRKFLHHIKFISELTGKVVFANLLNTIPLYTTFEARKCLGIEEYVRYLFIMDKIDEIIKREKMELLYNKIQNWHFSKTRNSKKLEENSNHHTNIPDST